MPVPPVCCQGNYPLRIKLVFVTFSEVNVVVCEFGSDAMHRTRVSQLQLRQSYSTTILYPGALWDAAFFQDGLTTLTGPFRLASRSRYISLPILSD